jgi:hypothetical protein
MPLERIPFHQALVPLLWYFNFGEDKNKTTCHMRPSVSYGYAPSFEKYYDTYASDATGTITKQYSRFETELVPGQPILH